MILPQKGRLRTRCPGASTQVEPGCDAEGGLFTSTTSLAAGDGGWPPRVALTRSSCIRRSNVYAGLMGSVEAVPRTLPMSPIGQNAKYSVRADIFPLVLQTQTLLDAVGTSHLCQNATLAQRCHNDAQVHRSYGCIVVRIGIGVSSPRKICSPSGCQGPGVAPAKGAVASSG